MQQMILLGSISPQIFALSVNLEVWQPCKSQTKLQRTVMDFCEYLHRLGVHMDRISRVAGQLRQLTKSRFFGYQSDLFNIMKIKYVKLWSQTYVNVVLNSNKPKRLSHQQCMYVCLMIDSGTHLHLKVLFSLRYLAAGLLERLFCKLHIWHLITFYLLNQKQIYYVG